MDSGQQVEYGVRGGAIRLLPADVSSKIAAGEVVERPASVVKELVENSLDAGATGITVEITGGGADRILVVDNGRGIPPGEIELAFERFATSKVADQGDLEGISTLGFRGEALPSIAAVSTVVMTSRTPSEESGTRLRVVEGRTAGRERAGAPNGTSVSVSHLFRNFPARRKFLRSAATETSRIQALMVRYALAYPEKKFRLSVAGSEALATTGSGDLREAVAAVYGLDTAQGMLEIARGPDGSDPAAAITGMVGSTSLHRANRNRVNLFVNRRWVQVRSLGYAVEQAYHGFLMERRFPVAVVNVDLPPEEVDVNVHPAKTEVRFRREGAVFAALQQAVRRTVMADSPVPEVGRPGAGRFGHEAAPAPGVFWPSGPLGSASSQRGDRGAIGGAGPPAPPSYPPREALPALRVLGQVQNTYVAAEGPDGIYLIDQHAAHERVIFEQVRAGLASAPPDVQSLLEPVTVELDPEQQDLLASQQDLVGRLGFLVEPFGGRAYLLRGVPGLLSHRDPGGALADVLDSMAEGGGMESWEDRAAYSIACHTAIRAGKRLSHEEMSELTRKLEQCLQPNTCPHGRPTMVHLSSGQLEREFGRR